MCLFSILAGQHKPPLLGMGVGEHVLTAAKMPATPPPAGSAVMPQPNLPLSCASPTSLTQDHVKDVLPALTTNSVTSLPVSSPTVNRQEQESDIQVASVDPMFAAMFEAIKVGRTMASSRANDMHNMADLGDTDKQSCVLPRTIALLSTNAFRNVLDLDDW